LSPKRIQDPSYRGHIDVTVPAVGRVYLITIWGTVGELASKVHTIKASADKVKRNGALIVFAPLLF
jgi:hypothetical protein